MGVLEKASLRYQHAPGRPKSDVLDCQWIRRPHGYGLLTGSFRPSDEVMVLRGYQRQREMLIRYAGQHVQHMQKALEEMNVKLTEVMSDFFCGCGSAALGNQSLIELPFVSGMNQITTIPSR